MRGGDRFRGYSLGHEAALGDYRGAPRRPRSADPHEPTNGLDPAGVREMRQLIIGQGEALAPALGTLAWLTVLLLVFVPLAVRVFRRA